MLFKIIFLWIFTYILFYLISSDYEKVLFKYAVTTPEFYANYKNVNFSNFLNLIPIALLIFGPLCIIIFRKWYKYVVFQGIHGIILAYICNKKLFIESKKKMYWHRLFNKYNISTPKLLGIIENKNFKQLNNSYSENKKYIIKPDLGMLGEGIEFESVNKFIKDDGIDQKYLVQERIYDCTIEKKYPRHYRFITYIEDGKVNPFMLIEYKLKKSNKLKSNFEKYSIKTNCSLDGCKHFNDNEKKYMEIAMKKLIKLHSKELSCLIIIGWDIMLGCDNYYVLEGNYGPVLCYRKTYDGCKKDFEKFNNIYIKFFNNLKSKKLIS